MDVCVRAENRFVWVRLGTQVGAGGWREDLYGWSWGLFPPALGSIARSWINHLGQLPRKPDRYQQLISSVLKLLWSHSQLGVPQPPLPKLFFRIVWDRFFLLEPFPWCTQLCCIQKPLSGMRTRTLCYSPSELLKRSLILFSVAQVVVVLLSPLQSWTMVNCVSTAGRVPPGTEEQCVRWGGYSGTIWRCLQLTATEQRSVLNSERQPWWFPEKWSLSNQEGESKPMLGW